jgi:hypothetical protein
MQQSRERLNMELRHSKWLLGYYLTIYTQMSLLCFTLLKAPDNVIAMTALVIHAVWEIRKTGWLSSDKSINRFELSSLGDVVIFQSTHKAYYRIVRSYACNWFVILTLESPETKHIKRVFISLDAVENDVFRKLNILLKHSKLYLQ